MINIKMKERNRLDLSHGLKRALFVVKLGISKLFKQKQFQPPHLELHLSDAICDVFSCSEQVTYYIKLKV
jgi:hypothetical protein